MKKILNAFTLLPRILRNIPLFLLRLFITFIPRKKGLWVFDSWRGERFADNSKYFFLYVLGLSEMTPVWISKDKSIITRLKEVGVRAEYANSLKGLWFTIRAEKIFTDCHPLGVNYFLTGGAIVINLWHGTMFKKVIYDSIATKKYNFVYSSKGIKRFIHFLHSPERFFFGNYFLSPGNLWDPLFVSASRLGDERIIKADYPRNSVWNDPHKLEDIGVDEDALVDVLRVKEQGRKVVFYMPTFRDGTHNPLNDSGIVFSELNDFLKKNNSHIFIKFHHENEAYGKYENIHFVESATDPYPLLKHTDVLITDYSSISFDFLFTNKPILFFAYDLEAYKNSMREMYFDYDSMIAGEKVTTFDALLSSLENTLKGGDEYRDRRQGIMNKVWDQDRIDGGRELLFKKIKQIN